MRIPAWQQTRPIVLDRQPKPAVGTRSSHRDSALLRPRGYAVANGILHERLQDECRNESAGQARLDLYPNFQPPLESNFLQTEIVLDERDLLHAVYSPGGQDPGKVRLLVPYSHHIHAK